MDNGRALKREKYSFVAASTQCFPWQYAPYQVLYYLLVKSNSPVEVDTKVLYTTTKQKLLKRKCIF